VGVLGGAYNRPMTQQGESMPWPLKAVAVTLSGAIGVAVMANSVHWAWVGSLILAFAAVYVTYTILGYSPLKGWINRSILAAVILFGCWMNPCSSMEPHFVGHSIVAVV
jgi:hypothetical protein